MKKNREGRTIVACVALLALTIAVFVLSLDSLIQQYTNPVIDKPLQSWTYEDHEWVTYNSGGLAHHPDCPCKVATSE